MNQEILKFNSFDEACAYFKMNKPIIFVNYPKNSPNNAELASAVIAELKSKGLEIQSQADLRGGSETTEKLRKMVKTSSHTISIVSGEIREGIHIMLERAAKDKSEYLPDNRTNLFYLAETASDADQYKESQKPNREISTWETETERINFIIGMIENGPVGKALSEAKVDRVVKDYDNKYRIIILDGEENLLSACQHCGAAISNKLQSICHSCKRGITHLEEK